MGYVLSLVELDGPLGFLFGFCPGIAKGGDLKGHKFPIESIYSFGSIPDKNIYS